MPQPSEEEWVRRARERDRLAFAALVELYWDRIRRWLYTLTHHAQLAEDLTQEVFVKAWINLPKLQSDRYFRAWLFRIARNYGLDSRKGNRGVAHASLPESLPGVEGEPLTALLEEEAHQQFLAACARLPVLYRAAYLLWTQEEMPYSEMARVLGVSEETARWRVCKARQFLVQELKPFLERTKP